MQHWHQGEPGASWVTGKGLWLPKLLQILQNDMQPLNSQCLAYKKHYFSYDACSSRADALADVDKKERGSQAGVPTQAAYILLAITNTHPQRPPQHRQEPQRCGGMGIVAMSSS